MITVQFFDFNEKPLNIGDLVRVVCKGATFYCYFKIINGYVIPFDTFSFQQVVKLAEIPKTAVKTTSDPAKDLPVYDYWYLPKDTNGENISDEQRMAYVCSEVNGHSKYCKLKHESTLF